MALKLTFSLLLVFLFAICLSNSGVHAFGAGNIPSFAYMEGRAFRHGDIEDALSDLFKKSSGGGFALTSFLSHGHKFGSLDVKRVYFGNWLRDYSQAVDIAGLKKLSLQTIINMCMALGFLAHGYATAEFEVTPERLGVYLPTEHIDNPKGYGEGEDARKYDPRLRGPVDPMELEVDPRTGMKNYIANENGHWDTSKGLVRRTLERCIHLGRQHRASGRKEDEYEAYRLLGQSLHTLEDFSAHSNFCELALVSMGHTDVFVHVGEQVKIQAPNRKWVAPLVTGTFGGSDFMHSLLGEATDHISEASVTDLSKELDKARSVSARSGPGSADATLRDLLFKMPGTGGGEMTRELEGIERIRSGPSQGGKRPEDMSPQELHAVMWQVFCFRDMVVKKIEMTIEKIPGLQSLVEKLMSSIEVFVLTTLEPFLKPLLKTASTGLASASSEVINTQDQYEVFNDPRASDPTHSFLSKDHFGLILNEPAGHLAKIILIHTVNLVIKAWDNNSVNVQQTTSDILECLFHPEFHNNNSKIQREMLQYMRTWVEQLGSHRHQELQRLNKAAVRAHENVRRQGEGGAPAAQGGFAWNEGMQMQHSITNAAGQIPGVQQAQSVMNMFGGAGGRRELGDYHGIPTPSAFPGSPGPPSSGTGFPGSPQSHSSGPPSSYPGTPQNPSVAPPSGYPGSKPNVTPASPSGFPDAPQAQVPSPHAYGQAQSQSMPSFPDAAPSASPYGSAPSQQSGYAPSYAPPAGGPHRESSYHMPTAASSFPNPNSPGYGGGGYAPPYGGPPGPQGGYNSPPGGLGGYGTPAGPPGGFAPPPGPPGGYGAPGFPEFPGSQGFGDNAPPAFPGAGGAYQPPGGSYPPYGSRPPGW